MVQFADEGAAGNGDFGCEIFEALACAVFVIQAAEVGVAVGPLIQEETGNLGVALESGNLIQLALEGDAVCVGHKVAVALPNGKIAIHEGFNLLYEALDGLLVLGAARTTDGSCRSGEQGVVLQGHQHLVADVACYVFFFILEDCVAQTCIRNHQFFVVAVKAVCQIMSVTCVGAHSGVDTQSGVLGNAVHGHRKELTGILVEVAFVIQVDGVQIADCRAGHVHRANCVQHLVTVLQQEGAVFGTQNPCANAGVVVLFCNDVVNKLLCDFQTLRSGTHGVDGEFLEDNETQLVADVQCFFGQRSAAATNGVETLVLDGLQVLFQLGVVVGPKAAFAPLLVVADTLNLQDLVVQVVVALQAVELAETESLDNREGIFRTLYFLTVLFLTCLDFQLEFNSIGIRMFRSPQELVLLHVLHFEDVALGGVFLVQLDVVDEMFEYFAGGISHEHAEASHETAGVVKADFASDAFLVQVRFHLNVVNECCSTQDQFHVTVDTAKGILIPGQAHRHFAGMGKAVVCAFLGFATKVDTAIGGTHICNTDAKNVFFANLQSLLSFQSEGSVCTKVCAQQLTVQPYSGMSCNSVKAEENSLGNLLFVFNSETLEIVGAVLGHQKLVKCAFPDVGDGDGFGVFRISCIPAVGDTCVFGVPDHLPIACKAQNFAH